MQKVEVLVCNQGTTFSFRFKAHRATTPEDLHLGGELYPKPSKEEGLPEGINYELEILNEPLEFKVIARAHWHLSRKTNKMYVCYTPPIPTEEKIAEVLNIWCCGVLYAQSTLHDFAEIVQPQDKFFEKLKKEHNIYPISVRFLKEGEEFDS